MLGEILGQESGKLTGMRVLPSDGPGPKMESSFQANAKIVGLDGTDTGTYWAVVQPDGSLFGENIIRPWPTASQVIPQSLVRKRRR
jgi:hypothetical protein